MELSPTYQKINELLERSDLLSSHLELEEKKGRLRSATRNGKS